MDAFLHKAKEIHTIEEAIALLWKEVPTPSSTTQDALALAIKAHDGQKRKSGEPYVVHPILVASITANFSNDEMMVQAALLHDVIEDTSHTIEELIPIFGEDVAHMVEGLTKIVQIRDEELVSSASNERLINSALSFRKMLIASIQDVRVLVIKLCDRVHNMLTLEALNSEKQIRISEETLVVYAPIAHRLGISRLKNELEDLSFAYIYPDEYQKIDTYINSNRQNLQVKLNSFIQTVEKMMQADGFNQEHFEIIGRVKHYYSIYLKMQRKGISIEEVLDLLAIRIVVKEPIACYKVLGLLHLNFTPLVSRFKDYIAVPKENGYQTIHTTLFDAEGIVEAQIRTVQMHRLSEYGIAAHWKYKEGKSSVGLEWLESLHYQKESVEEFYEMAKFDLFSEDITVFSPKGDYFTLPKGSVVLDFAYAIHSEVGANAMDALVNKQKASLLTILKNGDIVNIIKDNKPHLYCSWGNAVKTSRAQEGIRSACRARIRESNTFSAYNILSTIFMQPHTKIKELIDDIGLSESIDKLPTQLDYFKETIHQVDDYMQTQALDFWEVLKKGYKKPTIQELEHFLFFTNKPLDGVTFDYCCHPKVGDEIVSFYEEKKAVIHHKLCKKAYSKIVALEQMLYVSWRTPKLSRFCLTISLQNQKGILADLLAEIYKLNLNILSIELGIRNSEQAEFCQIEVESSQLTKEFLVENISQKFKLIDIVSLDDAYNK